MTPGADLIAAERARQMEQEGWTPEHDDAHIGWDLSRAAKCYVLAADYASAYDEPLRKAPADWPWHFTWWKPTDDPVRMLTKAGALIAAEIDRVQRLQAKAADQ